MIQDCEDNEGGIDYSDRLYRLHGRDDMVFGYSLCIIPQIYVYGLVHQYSIFTIEALYLDIMPHLKLSMRNPGSIIANIKKFALSIRRNYAIS
jgi:hypothetical protein